MIPLGGEPCGALAGLAGVESLPLAVRRNTGTIAVSSPLPLSVRKRGGLADERGLSVR